MQNENEGSATGEQTGGSKSSPVDWTQEEAYWRKQHSNQPYADKARSYEDYAAAYRLGVEGAVKHAGRDYDEVEDSLAADWERAQTGSAIPWDTVRPAVRAAWDRIGGVISPRDQDRGIRGSI